MYYSLSEGVIVRERLCAFPQPFDCVAITASNEDYGLTRDLARLLGTLDGTRSVEATASEWGAASVEVLARLATAGILAVSDAPARNAKHENQFRKVDALVASCRAAIWHLTRRCNLGCSHCYYLYQPESISDFTEEQLVRIADNLLDIGVEYVTVTGGEVLANPSNFRLLTGLLTAACLPFGVNTNGTYDVRQILAIRSPYLRMVQSSIDGPLPVHDRQRGVPGSYQRTMGFLATLASNGIFTRVVSMLTEPWMTPQSVLSTARELSARGVRDWLIELPSSTGRWRQTADSDSHSKLVEIASALYRYCSDEPHSFKRVSLNQVFEWPLSRKIAKVKTDAACSHDLGLLSFGTEGVSYCTLFREQFGKEWKDIGSAAGDLRTLWNRIAEFRVGHTIADNPACSACEIFDWCQGGCPGQYTEPAALRGCDQHSRSLALVKRELFDTAILPAAFAPANTHREPPPSL